MEKNIYLFIARGCPLTYFVIWGNGQIPTPEKWIKVNPISENNYFLVKEIENNNGINFHVYNGNTPEDCRGECLLPPEKKFDFIQKLKNKQKRIIL